MWENAVWLGVPEKEIKDKKIYEGDMNGRFAYYRCSFDLDSKALTDGVSLLLDITANSRYRLWINGIPVMSGPCKGDYFRHYYDTVDLSGQLVAGENVLAVQVLFCDPTAVSHQGDERTPILSIASWPGGHRLAVSGTVINAQGEVLADITGGNAVWRVWLDHTWYLKSREINVYLGAICEDVDFNNLPWEWREIGFDDAGWCMAKKGAPVIPSEFDRKVGFYPRFPLKQRPIPLLFENKKDIFKEMGSHVLGENSVICVKAHQRKEFILDAGAIYNGYMIYGFTSGQGAHITMTYFERFENPEKKIKKSDYINGIFKGLTDTIILPEIKNIAKGCGHFTYQPFWVRTFRFVHLVLEAGEQDLCMEKPYFIHTGYPLQVMSEIHSSEKWVEDVWDICVRTLQNCMLETYMDCPFYEQMQFIMDTRLQGVFTFSVSTDTRLTRKALEDFHCSMMPEGLIQGKYPSSFPQIISTFSLYYIFFLHDYYMQTSDKETICMYRTDVDRILDYYDRKIGDDGLVGNPGFWPFVDWQEAWRENSGCPAALKKGPSTIINLMYAYALQCGAYLNKVTGRGGIEAEYLNRQQDILEKIRELCWDQERGMFREGPAFNQFSQHAQAWAVLNHIDTDEKMAVMLENALSDTDVIPCSFAASFELFRALELTGLYEKTAFLMKRWENLLELDCTTCPEEPENGRSECHAWSALPMYEMIRCMAGIQMLESGWKSVEISPNLNGLPDLWGKAATPGGIIEFSWRCVDGKIRGEIIMPEGLKGIYKKWDGSRVQLQNGLNLV